MQRIPCLGPHTPVSSKVGFVALHDQVAEHSPSENVESIHASWSNYHEDNNEALDRAFLELPDNLVFALERDVTEPGDIPKLP